MNISVAARALGKYSVKNTNKTKMFCEYSLISDLSQFTFLKLILLFHFKSLLGATST